MRLSDCEKGLALFLVFNAATLGFLALISGLTT